MKDERIVLRSEAEAIRFRVYAANPTRGGIRLQARADDPTDSRRDDQPGLYWLRDSNREGVRGKAGYRIFRQERGETHAQLYRRIKKVLLQERLTAQALIWLIVKLFPDWVIKPYLNTDTRDTWQYWPNGEHSSSGYLSFPTRHLGNLIQDYLDRSINQILRAEYPYLWPSAFQMYLEHPHVAWWIKSIRNGREVDGEGTRVITQFPLTGKNKHVLAKLNEEGRKKFEWGGFYCTLCGQAKHPEEYGTYYFAAKACKDCCEANPGFVRKARSETYN